MCLALTYIVKLSIEEKWGRFGRILYFWPILVSWNISGFLFCCCFFRKQWNIWLKQVIKTQAFTTVVPSSGDLPPLLKMLLKLSCSVVQQLCDVKASTCHRQFIFMTSQVLDIWCFHIQLYNIGQSFPSGFALTEHIYNSNLNICNTPNTEQ